MTGVWLLSTSYLRHHAVRSGILVVCLALTLFLPVTTRLLVNRYEDDLRARSDSTPLIAGAKGNRIDLTMTTLYFRAADVEPITYADLERLEAAALGIAIPVHARFTARGHPVVATSPEYHEMRGLTAARGSLPLRLGDATLGSAVAEELGLGPGDALFSDVREAYDISVPPALKMRIAGVLAPAGTPDDGAVFVDTKTAWILEGIYHGHDDPEKEVDEELLIGKTDEHVAVSPAMIEYNEVTDENISTFHWHGETSLLPLTSVIFRPRDAKSGTIIKARLNASKTLQMVTPTEVIDDLMAFVFKIKSILDAVSLLLAATTVGLFALVVLLTMRVRAGEMRTLDRIGASRSTVLRLYATEIGILVILGLALAAALSVAVLTLAPDVVDAL